MTLLVLHGSFAFLVKMLAENLKKVAVTWLPGNLLFRCMVVIEFFLKLFLKPNLSVDEIDFVGRGAPCQLEAVHQLCSNRANEGHEISIPLLLPSLLLSYCRPLIIDCRLRMLLQR